MPNPPRPASLKRIAEKAGVSAATVSRVLNQRDKGFSVRPEVRLRVLTAAESLNYRPDIVAQSLRQNRSRIVGILARHIPINLPEGVLHGLLSVFDPAGLHLNIYCVPRSKSYQQLPPWRLDGAVAYGVVSPAEIQAVEDAGIPYVSLNGSAGPRGDVILYDDADGMRQALNHLYGLGHRRIAYAHYGGLYAGHCSETARRDAYRTWMEQHGLAPMQGYDRPLPDPPDDYLNQTVRRRRATAIVAYHHFQAVGLLQAAGRANLSVPKDFSLVCFNDDYPVMFLNPALTVLRLPSEEAAAQGARLLLQRIESPDRPRSSIILKEVLVVRDSTGPTGLSQNLNSPGGLK